MNETFIPHVNPHVKDLTKPVILFVDGHASHISLAMHDLCRDAGIIYYLFPSHTSYIIQPLDLVHFKALKAAWFSSAHKFKQIHRREVKKENCLCLQRCLDSLLFKGQSNSLLRQVGFVLGILSVGTTKSVLPQRFSKKTLVPASQRATPSSTPDSHAHNLPGPSSSPAPITADLPGPSSSPAPVTANLPGPSFSPAPGPIFLPCTRYRHLPRLHL